MSVVERIPFSELGEVIAGQHIPAEQYNGDDNGTPYLTGPADFTDRVPEVTKWTHHPRSFAESGDVLLTVKGAGCGKSNLGLDAAIGRQLMALRPDKSKLDRNYLFAFIRSQEERICAMGQGATVPGIAKRDIERLRVPYFPLSEQRRIAAILDKADTIRHKREEGIRLTEELLRSTFLEMFGDPATNPNGWKAAAVEEGLSRERSGMRCGPFGTALRKEEYVSKGIPVWGIENVQPNLFLEEGSHFISEDKYSELSAYSVHSGDVLISRAGTVGRMCVARPRQQDSIIGTNLIRVALDQTVIAPDYFTALFTYFADRVAGLRASSDDGAYSFMQTGVLRNVRVPLPPIEKQRAYAGFVELTRKNQTRRNEGLQASRLLFNSLVQRAFRGEL